MASIPPLMPPPLLPNPLELLPAALNHLTRGETWARQTLAAHAGKTVMLRASPFELALTIASGGEVELALAHSLPNLTVEFPLAALPRVLSGGAAALFEKARIAGDAELAKAVSSIGTGLTWDAEEDLSRVVGDIAAHRLVGVARAVGAGARRANANLAANVAEYFLDENRELVRPREVEALALDIAELDSRTTRIEARFAKLSDRKS